MLPNVLLLLSDIFEQYNQYCRIYKSAYEILRHHEHDDNFYVSLVFDSSNDQRRHNFPTADEVAAVVPGSDTQVTKGHDIILRYRDGCLNKISDSSPAYHPLYYCNGFS